MKESTYSKLVNWFKNPDPDTILLKLWKKKRDKDKIIQNIEAKKQEEELKKIIEKEAYLLWEADGKPKGKDKYYWELAENKIKGNNLPTIYKPYYLLEKRVLEPSDEWISRQAFFTILGRLGNLALIAAVLAFIFGENIRRNNEVFSAWTTITTAHEQPGSGGRIEALEFLNSRPWRFPFIGWTKKDWYWDERENKCKEGRLPGLRWKRQPLAGLSAPKAYLANIHLCGANLDSANLQNANLDSANLQNTDLSSTNIQNADLSSTNIQNANLDSANLQNADLSSTNIQNANLDSANLQDAILQGANLQDARLDRANLQNADLGWANLQNAELFRANLQNAFPSTANLQDARLARANLQNAELFRANLQNAELFRANLQDANLDSANLQNTDLGWANLQNAFLKDAQNLTPQQIKSACNWEEAIYKGKWNQEDQKWVTSEPDNTNYIKELKEDTTSDPKEPPDCSRWDRFNE